MDAVDRRMFLKAVGSAGLFAALPEAAAFGADGTGVVHEVAQPSQDAGARPKYSVKFAVAGMSHDHIYGMVGAMLRGGGELVSVYAAEPERGEEFRKRFPQAKKAESVDEILNDPSIQLVLSSAIPAERAPIGIRVMQHGKDYLSDKPGITTLEQLAEVRRVQAETKRIYGIMYSERLEVRAAVKAGELVQQGAIGKVIQTINIAPHLIQYPNQPPRPEWFWDPVKYGGILTDIGSHQVDQFLFYTGSKEAEVVASQVANVNHPEHAAFQDFGDVMLRGDKGLGYVRVDWFTPDGLGVWGDGRLFLLGTEGYIELRKYVDIAGRKGGNHLFIADQKQTRYIDCSQVELPFGPQFISDIVNRTETGQSQAQTLLAAELVLKAQKQASVVHLKA
jgi:predicted dehydrogenase